MGAFLHWAQRVLNSWYVKTTGIGRWVKTGICSSLQRRYKNQNFLENLTSAAQFRVIDFFLAMTVYLPIWHSHCTRARFTVLASCSGELTVHSCPLLSLQSQVTKLASGFFYCWSSLCNNFMATNFLMFTSSYDIRRFAACACWSRHLGR